MSITHPTPEESPKEEPWAYGFTCENYGCQALMYVYPHPESPGLPDPFVTSAPPDDPWWEYRSPDCPACGEPMDLLTGDPVSHVIRISPEAYR